MTLEETLINNMANLWREMGGDAEGFSIYQGRIFDRIEELDDDWKHEPILCMTCNHYVERYKMHTTSMCKECDSKRT